MTYEEYVMNHVTNEMKIHMTIYKERYIDLFNRIEELGWPMIVSARNLAGGTTPKDITGLDRKAKAFGYKKLRCPSVADGRWLVKDEHRRMSVYIRAEKEHETDRILAELENIGVHG